MVAQNLFFYGFAAVTLFSAIRVVTSSNVVHAALYLVVTLLSVAGAFLMLGAEFLADYVLEFDPDRLRVRIRGPAVVPAQPSF